MNRGNLVIVSAPGDYGKPRPAVVVQSDWLSANDSVLVALCTSTVLDAPFYRLDLAPSEAHGLKAPTQVMVDKIVAMPREKCGAIIGRLDEREIAVLNHMLAVVIGIADGPKPKRDRPPRYGKARVGKARLGS
ncbi:MAG TPA: type II toxin-antitoxin system PemK/MazF family toxin [Roseiarcus sp.]|nr:type II toxin-antitoxin system PemK/MazF family toxin [Roseiarcus sp.]